MFLDESGDPNLKSVDPNHPVFALVGCILKDDYYQNEAIPLVNDLKIKYFKTKKIILHSRDIRKQESKPWFIDKKQNEIGTQVADLIAYPIATYILPERDKKAFEIIKSKIIKSKNEKVFGYGVKIFP